LLTGGPTVLSLTFFTFVIVTFSLSTVVYSRTLFYYFPHVTLADVVDIFAPYSFILLYSYQYYQCREKDFAALILREKKANKLILFELLLFMLVCVGWISEHGLHPSSNSVHNLIDREYFSHKNIKSAENKELLVALHSIVDFWDEQFSHYLWHGSIIGIEAVVMWCGRGSEIKSIWDYIQIFVGAVLHGFTFCGAYIEGGTYIAGFPFVVIAILIMIGKHGYIKIKKCPILAYYFISNVAAAGGFAWWGFVTNWTFPEFSEIGMLFSKQ